MTLPSPLRRRLAEFVPWLGVAVLILVGGLSAAKEILPKDSRLGVLVSVVTVVFSASIATVGAINNRLRLRRELNSLIRPYAGVRDIDPYRDGLLLRPALADLDYPKGEPPYVERSDVDRDIDDALRNQLVLITGPAAAGKSHCALAAIRRLKPEPSLLVPRQPDALERLLKEPSSPLWRLSERPAVLWLDNLEIFLARYLELPVSLTSLVNNHSSLKVVSILRDAAEGDLRRQRGPAQALRGEFLKVCSRVHVPRRDDSALAEAKRLYPSVNFDTDLGIGETFVAGSLLLDRLRRAQTEDAAGFAVVAAVLDWTRAGTHRPIEEGELGDLFKEYLQRAAAYADLGADTFVSAKRWATTPDVDCSVPLVQHVGDGTYSVFPYVLEAIDDGAIPELKSVRSSVFVFARSHSTPLQCEAIGLAAHGRNLHAVALETWLSAAGSSDTLGSPRSAFHIGLYAMEHPDLVAAETGDSPDVDQQVKWFRRAADSPEPLVRGAALINLGIRLQEKLLFEDARDAFSDAASLPEFRDADAARVNLGLLLWWHFSGQKLEAAKHFEQVIRSGDPNWAPIAALNLGHLQSNLPGGRARAIEAYCLARDSGHPDAAEIARSSLQNLVGEDTPTSDT
jgi:tetratricopeptide (TPR) repeat protein